MSDPNDTPKKPAHGGGEVLLRCTVLVAGTIIKRLKTGKGHRCRLPESQAKALAALNPPAVRIDGI